MKSIRIKNILLLALLLLASCSQELVDVPAPLTDKEVVKHVTFKVAPLHVIGGKGEVQTKATDPATVDDAQISNLWIVQYDKATKIFLKKSYTEDVNTSSFDAPLAANVSGNCNIYFIANIGPVLPTLYTETEFQNYYKDIATEAAFLITGKPISGNTKKNIPMSAVLNDVNVPISGTTENLAIVLKRMLARVEVEYTIADDLTTYFKLESVRLCNVPLGMQLVSPSNGVTNIAVRTFPVAPLGASDITTGAHTLVYYIPENLKGLGANTAGTDARLKGGVEGATYIEFMGHINGTQAGQEAGYCIYPGADEFNDYNLVRNTKYKIQATFSNISPSDQRVKIHDANCFMLRPGGSCNISVLRANKTDLGIQIPDVSTGWTAEVYWQTTQDMITVNDATTKSLGYFKVTAAAGKEGNALVVVKVGTKVVWSWHIWVLNDDLNLPAFQQAYPNFTWMDRNLGATRTTTYNITYTYSAIGGMMYQWGRKDPIIGAINTITNPAPFTLYGASGSTQFAPPNYTDAGSIATATNDPYIRAATSVANSDMFKISVKYPALYINNWLGSTAKDASTNAGRDSWGGEFNQPKTIYDPCPEGWRVPSAKSTSTTYTNPWSTFSVSSWPSTTAADGNVGAIYVQGNSTPWQVYPMIGIRGNGATFQNINYVFAYTATASSNTNAYSMFIINGTFNNNYSLTKLYAGSVRCVKEW